MSKWNSDNINTFLNIYEQYMFLVDYRAWALFKRWNKLLPYFVQLSHSIVYKVISIKILVCEVVLPHDMVAGCQHLFLTLFCV